MHSIQTVSSSPTTALYSTSPYLCTYKSLCPWDLSHPPTSSDPPLVSQALVHASVPLSLRCLWGALIVAPHWKCLLTCIFFSAEVNNILLCCWKLFFWGYASLGRRGRIRATSQGRVVDIRSMTHQVKNANCISRNRYWGYFLALTSNFWETSQWSMRGGKREWPSLKLPTELVDHKKGTRRVWV